jgi:Phage terminase, small subunit
MPAHLSRRAQRAWRTAIAAVDDPVRYEAAVADNARSVRRADALQRAWQRAGRPATAPGGPHGQVLVAHPLLAAMERAEDHTAKLAASLGLTPDGYRKVKPKRWVLIDRESAVPDSEAAAGRWSVDHLFLDQDGVPTLVEVKRSSDTRIRREVVGQLIDYAANAVVYWPLETLRSSFDSRLEREGRDADVELAAVLEPDADPEVYGSKRLPI